MHRCAENGFADEVCLLQLDASGTSRSCGTGKLCLPKFLITVPVLHGFASNPRISSALLVAAAVVAQGDEADELHEGHEHSCHVGEGCGV